MLEPVGYDGFGAPLYAWQIEETPDAHPSNTAELTPDGA